MNTTPSKTSNQKDVYETAIERAQAGISETVDAREVLNLPRPEHVTPKTSAEVADRIEAAARIIDPQAWAAKDNPEAHPGWNDILVEPSLKIAENLAEAGLLNPPQPLPTKEQIADAILETHIFGDRTPIGAAIKVLELITNQPAHRPTSNKPLLELVPPINTDIKRPVLTAAQTKAWPNVVAEAQQHVGAATLTPDITSKHWCVTEEPETSPNSPPRIEATWCDGVHLVQIFMDPQGNYNFTVAEVWPDHDGCGSDCACEPCSEGWKVKK